MARKSTFTDEQKAKIVAESNEGTLEEVATKHGISVPTLSLWRKGAKKRGAKKAKRTNLGRKAKAAASGVDLTSVMEELAMVQKFKELLAEFGYVKK